MKKFLIAFICGLIGVVLGFGCYMIADERGWIPDKEDPPKLVIDTVEYTTPVIYTIQDIQKIHADCIKQFVEDSVFRCIPSSVIPSISAVLLKRDGNITIQAVVDEYINNSLIYNTLAIQDKPQNTTQISTEKEVRNKNDTVQYQFVDTTINGNNIKMAKKLIQ